MNAQKSTIVERAKAHALAERARLDEANQQLENEKKSHAETLREVQNATSSNDAELQQKCQRLEAEVSDLSAQIDRTIDRFVDLMLIIKDHFYDYRFYGSFSLKRVLPVLTNESGYDELDGVKDGDGAQAQFYDLINNSLNEEDRIKVKKQLLEYCEKDTYSLVQIHQKLISLLN